MPTATSNAILCSAARLSSSEASAGGNHDLIAMGSPNRTYAEPPEVRRWDLAYSASHLRPSACFLPPACSAAMELTSCRRS